MDIENVTEKFREARVSWLKRVLRKEDRTVREAFELAVTGIRKRGRQKLRWSDVINKDLEVKYLNRQCANNRT